MTTLPPSRGRTGSRLKAPIAGPAHHTAVAAGELPRLYGSNGSTPIASSTPRLTTMWVTGPANEIITCAVRDSGCGEW